MTITVQRLSSGYVRLQGNGPCEWAQPPHWPCDKTTLRAHAFPEASESFLRECDALAAAERGEAKWSAEEGRKP